jgi:hypothetical protein
MTPSLLRNAALLLAISAGIVFVVWAIGMVALYFFNKDR